MCVRQISFGFRYGESRQKTLPNTAERGRKLVCQDEFKPDHSKGRMANKCSLPKWSLIMWNSLIRRQPVKETSNKATISNPPPESSNSRIHMAVKLNRWILMIMICHFRLGSNHEGLKGRLDESVHLPFLFQSKRRWDNDLFIFKIKSV